MKFNEETRHYIQLHADDDVNALALHPPKSPEIDFRFALQQIHGRQKAQNKLPTLHSDENIIYPAKVSMEQCSSEITAEYKSKLVIGESLTDLSGGFGIDTLAFANKTAKVTYVEPNPELCEIFKHNSSVLGYSNIDVICSKMEDCIQNIQDVDTIYIDPSRRNELGKRLISLEDFSPNIVDYQDYLQKKCKILLIKLSPMLDISEILQKLKNIIEIHIVAIDGDCKELLCLINPQQKKDVRIVCANFKKGELDIFSKTITEEKKCSVAIADKIAHYLYEPNVAIMKSGLYNSLSKEFQIEKLAPNTNIFTSDNLVNNFPGRIFTVEDSLHYQPKTLKKTLSGIKSASVAVRNFPLSAEQLRKALSLKDGNDKYVFGVTTAKSEKVVIVCDKVV